MSTVVDNDEPCTIVTNLKDLVKSCAVVNDVKDPAIVNVIYKLLETINSLDNAIGLAANQIGYNAAIFVIKINDVTRVCINPTYVPSENTFLIEQQEGCVSFPGEHVTVKRYKSIDVNYTNPAGNVVNETLHGLTAKCYQHEMDHLDGVVMFERQKGTKGITFRSRTNSLRKQGK